MHSQETLLKSQVALLKPAAHIQIHEIDAVKTTIIPTDRFSHTEYEIELLPGEHVLKVSYDNGTFYSKVLIEKRILLEANKKYILKPVTAMKSFWKQTREWTLLLLDVTDKNECWTLSVGTLGGPKGCE